MTEEVSLKKLLHGVRAIVWDFDGILGDTEGLQMEKWNILLNPYGIQISLDEYIRHYCGKSSATEIPMLLKQKYGDRIPLTERELGQRAGEILQRIFETTPIELMPGARDALQFFMCRKLPMAVCSAKDPAELEMKLKNAGISHIFPQGLRSTQVEAGGFAKPHPAMYSLAVERLRRKITDINPYQCLAFEDTSAGVTSAAKADLRVVAMPNMYSEGQDFSLAHVIIRGGWQAFFSQLTNELKESH